MEAGGTEGEGETGGAPLDWANKHSCLVGRRSEEEQGGKGGAGEEGHVVTTCTSYALLSLSTVTITNMCSSPYVCQVSVALVLWALQITVADRLVGWSRTPLQNLSRPT